MIQRTAVQLLLACACVSFSRLASAQEPSEAELAGEVEAPRPAWLPTIPWRRWPIFDPFLSPREGIFSGVLFRARALGTESSVTGLGVTWGETSLSPHGVVYIRGSVQFGARLLDLRHVVLRFGQYDYAAGVALGPVELEARAGVTLFDLHLGSDEWGFGLLSPRVGAGASVHAAGIRVGLFAFGEYMWRWVGPSNLRVQGFSLEIAYDRPPKGLPPRYRLP